MKIYWLGHSSFRININDGTSIVTDPFDPEVGYDMPEHGADIVTVSHDHHDHNYVGTLAPKEVIRGIGTYEADHLHIEGWPSFHDDVFGAKRGRNIIFLFEADGVRVVHLGDLGHALTDAEIAHLGKVDVLLIPVGGVYTIDGAQAAELARRVGARITVPMHYATPKLGFHLAGPEAFLHAMGGQPGHADVLDPSENTVPVVMMTPGMGL